MQILLVQQPRDGTVVRRVPSNSLGFGFEETLLKAINNFSSMSQINWSRCQTNL